MFLQRKYNDTGIGVVQHQRNGRIFYCILIIHTESHLQIPKVIEFFKEDYSCMKYFRCLKIKLIFKLQIVFFSDQMFLRLLRNLLQRR